MYTNTTGEQDNLILEADEAHQHSPNVHIGNLLDVIRELDMTISDLKAEKEIVWNSAIDRALDCIVPDGNPALAAEKIRALKF